MPFKASTIFKAVDNFSAPVKSMQLNAGRFAKGFSSSFGSASEKFQDFSSRSIKSLENMGKKTSEIGNVMKGVLGASLLEQGIYGLIRFAKEGIKLSSDLIEVQNVVDTTFKANSKAINDWSKSAAVNFGISELQAKQFTGSLGAMMKSSGISGESLEKMSTNLSGLAGDFASFYNLPVEEAFNKIRAGISGETEPLKRLGVNMSVANLEAFALTQGLSKAWVKMSQVEQTQLRYAYLMKVSADAQGDFSKTLETSAANQERVLEMQKQAFSANLMKTLLPKQLELYKQLNVALVWMNNHTAELAVVLKTVGVILGFLAAKYLLVKTAIFTLKTAQVALGIAQGITYIVTGNLTSALLANATAMKMVAFWEKAVTAAQWLFNTSLLGCPIIWIIVGIMALVAGIVLLVKHWDAVKKSVDDFSNTAVGAILGIIFPFTRILELISFVQDRWQGLKKAFEGGFGNGLMAVGKMLLNFVLKPIETILAVIAKATGADWAKDALGTISEFRKGLDNGLIDESKVVNKDATLTEKQYSEKKTTQNVQIEIKDPLGRTNVTGGLEPIPIMVNSTRQF